MSAGIAYLALLLSFTKESVFFSGDGGLKFIMVQQILDGDLSPTLKLRATPEIENIWNDGFYPLGPPFVYKISEDYYPSFPIYFPLISAPLYVLFGYRGLYFFPALFLILTWLWIVARSRAETFRPVTTAMILLSLIFASPLTIYGATFWEHTIGAFLSSFSLFLFLGVQQNKNKPFYFAIAGFILGLGSFIRPEILVFLPCVAFAFLMSFQKQHLKNALVFFLSCFGSICVYFGFNLLIYGQFLGVHSLQILKGDISQSWWLESRLLLSQSFLVSLLEYWPAGIFIILSLPFSLFAPNTLRRRFLGCFSAMLIAIFLIALIEPNHGGKQWGPRYLLILIPWGTMLLGFSIETILQMKSASVKILAWTVFTACFIRGAYLNSYRGAVDLSNDYAYRVLPTHLRLKEQPHSFVIVTHQWIPLELGASMRNKVFFWMRKSEDLPRLAQHLKNLDIKEALFFIQAWYNVIPPIINSFENLNYPLLFNVYLIEPEKITQSEANQSEEMLFDQSYIEPVQVKSESKE